MVLSAAQPYLGHAFKVGQLIRAVDFDNGGQDVSFHVTTAKPQHPIYRNSPATIARQHNQYVLTRIVPGEWFNYTINVAHPGLYAVTAGLRAAKGSKGTFHLEVDGQVVSDTLPITPSGQAAQEHDLDLTAGTHVLRVVFDTLSGSGKSTGTFSGMRIYPSPMDVSFGNEGVVSNVLPGGGGTAHNAVVGADGKILISASNDGGDYLVRLNPDGSLDDSFGTSGIAQAPVWGPVAITPTGDIVLAGLEEPTDKTSSYTLARFHSDGTPDETFGSGGSVSWPHYGGNVAMGLRSDGDIVVASSEGSYRDTYLQVRAFSPSGSIDYAYRYGNVGLGLGVHGSELDRNVLDLQVLPGDRVMVASQTIVQSNATGSSEKDDAYLQVVTFSRQGYQDAIDNKKIGSSGSCCPETDEYVAAASIRPDGQVGDAVYSVYDRNKGMPVTMVMGRKTTFEVIDPAGGSGKGNFAYGVTGVSRYDYTVEPFASPAVSTLALQPDGKLLVLGSSGGAFAVARMNTSNGAERYAYTPPTATPLTIEAENFDIGGEGISYHDTTAANQGGLYRDTGVDIGDNGEDGLAVGWTGAGEWLDYTVKIARTGRYRISVRASSQGQGGSLHFTTGKASTGSIDVPDTGSWTTWQSLSGKPLKLKKGLHTLRLWLDSPGPAGSVANIDSFTLRAT